jgi:hypothetical protein
MSVRELARECANPREFLEKADEIFRLTNHEEAWRLLAMFLVNERRHAQRSNIKSIVKNCTRKGGWGALREAGDKTLSRMMDTWMVGDKTLGDCYRSDLLSAAEKEDAEAAGHEVNARFYRSLAKIRGSETKPLRAICPEAKIKEILAKATN